MEVVVVAAARVARVTKVAVAKVTKVAMKVTVAHCQHKFCHCCAGFSF